MISRLEPAMLAEPPRTRRRLPDLQQTSALNGGQWLGLVGTVLMLIGVWLPVFATAGGVTLWTLDAGGGGWPIYGPVVLWLTLLAAIATVRRWSLVLGLVGLAAYGVLALAWLVAEAMTPSAEPHGFRAGWLVLMLGAMLLLVAAIVGEHLAQRDRRPVIDLDFDFPPLMRNQSLAALQSGWQLRN